MPKAKIYIGGGAGTIEIDLPDEVGLQYTTIDVNSASTLEATTANYYNVDTTAMAVPLTLGQEQPVGTWFQVANPSGANPLMLATEDPAETINGLATLAVAKKGTTLLVKSSPTNWTAVFQPATNATGLVATASQFVASPGALSLTGPTTLCEVTVNVEEGQSLIISAGSEYDVGAAGAQGLTQNINVGVEGDIDVVNSSTTGPSDLTIQRTIQHTPSLPGAVTVALTAKYQIASLAPLPAASNASLVVQVVDV